MRYYGMIDINNILLPRVVDEEGRVMRKDMVEVAPQIRC